MEPNPWRDTHSISEAMYEGKGGGLLAQNVDEFHSLGGFEEDHMFFVLEAI
jgi:hypothetical protein